MSQPTMSENYKGRLIRATIVYAYFIHGKPSAQSIQSAGVSINGITLSLDQWEQANLSEEEYFAAMQGNNINLPALVNLAKRYIDSQG